jgi:hypothetical protein
LLLKFPGFGEGLEGAVVGFFGLGREAAAGQLSGGKVITYTFAAQALPFTAGIGTGTVFKVLVFVTFHIQKPPILKSATSGQVPPEADK